MGRREALIEKFRAITGERLVQLKRGFAQLERSPDDEGTLAEVERVLHTIKGEAKLLGLSSIGTLAQKLETVVPAAQSRRFSPESEPMKVMLAGLELIEASRQLHPRESVTAELDSFIVAVDGLVQADLPKRVLMIDDSELALEIQVMMLERRGYEVRGCLDLDEVRAAKDDFAPDVVLTDVGLGDVTVEEACQVLREAFGESVPILLFSGRADHELEALATALAIDGYVNKGATQQAIFDQIETVLRRARR